MDYISLYLQEKVTLPEILDYALKLRYRAYYATPHQVRVMVEFAFEYEGEQRTSAWAIWKADTLELYQTDPKLIADAEPALIEKFKPLSIFTISYRKYSLNHLFKLLHQLLNRFDGVVVMHDTFDYLTMQEIEAIASQSNG